VHTAGGRGGVRNSSAPRKGPTPLCPSTHRPDHPRARMAPTSCTSCTSCTVPTACTARTVIQAEGKDLLVVCHVCSVACPHNDARYLQQGQHSRAAGGGVMTIQSSGKGRQASPGCALRAACPAATATAAAEAGPAGSQAGSRARGQGPAGQGRQAGRQAGGGVVT
jgi:hypothetical protein